MLQDLPQSETGALSPRQQRSRRIYASFKNSGEVAVPATRPFLLRVARALGLCAEAARDLLHEVYCVLLARQDEPDDVEAWLEQVMRYQCWRWRRAERLREGLEQPLDDLDLPAADADSPELRLTVARLVGDLPDNHRELVVAHYAEGLSEREAAVRARLSPSSGKKILARIRADFRRVLRSPDGRGG